MHSLSSGILLEGAIVSVARENCLGAVGLSTLEAEFAAQARAIQPFNASIVTNLKVGDILALGNNDASAFVATDKRKLGVKGPVTVVSVEVSVADTRVLDVDKNLVGRGGGDREVGLVEERSAVLLKYYGFLGLGDGSHFGIKRI